MAKEPRTKLSGKEARYILHQNHISLAWLAQQIGIKPQSLNSRQHEDTAIRTILDELAKETPEPHGPGETC